MRFRFLPFFFSFCVSLQHFVKPKCNRHRFSKQNYGVVGYFYVDVVQRMQDLSALDGEAETRMEGQRNITSPTLMGRNCFFIQFSYTFDSRSDGACSLALHEYLLPPFPRLRTFGVVLAFFFQRLQLPQTSLPSTAALIAAAMSFRSLSPPTTSTKRTRGGGGGSDNGGCRAPPCRDRTCPSSAWIRMV